MKRSGQPIRSFLRRLGPGLITGASADDPSGIATYSQAGASLGYSTLWTAIITLPLMIVVQHMCAKIGLRSGRGLAGVLRHFYSRWLLYPAVVLLLIANTINAGTDISAIAAAINIFVPVPIVVLVVPIAAAIVALQIWASYKMIVRTFKWLTMSLFGYVIAAFLAQPDWYAVAKATLIPHLSFDGQYIMTLVAILGTTISPYLFFWEASEEVEDEKAKGRTRLEKRRGVTAAELRAEKVDTATGMLFCNVVFYFVILAAASTLHRAGQTDISSAAEAAQALTPLAGRLASVLFATGIIGAGLLAIPVLTSSAAFAVAETFDWPAGLDEKPRHAKKFYSVIAVSTVVGVGVDLIGIDPMKALLYTAVLNGILAPPLLIVVLLIANNKRVMGDQVNGRVTNVVGALAAFIMSAAAIAMLLTWRSS